MANNNSNPVDLIYKSLRLVPDFDGNPHVLPRFINLCDQLVLRHINTQPGNELTNLALINGILNKISGSAARLINSNGIPENWQGIKSALINNFADHRDETALYSDLSLQTQGSSTPQEFYERCQNLFSTIMTYVSLHESLQTTIDAKRSLYQKLTLQAYLRGLKDPLGSRIRCMRPESMEKALEFVQDELNTLYMQQRNEGGSNRKEWPRPVFHSNNLPLNNFVPRAMPFNLPGPSKQQGFVMPGPTPQYTQRPQPTQGWRPHLPPHFAPPQGLTRTQQIMRAHPPNYNPQSNVFKVPYRPQPHQPHNFSNAPRPMSGVSHFVPKTLPPSGHDWRRFGNPPPNNYFKSREANFNEFDCYNYDYNYTDLDENWYDYEWYNDSSYNNEIDYCLGTPVVQEMDQNPTPANDENFQIVSKSDKPK